MRYVDGYVIVIPNKNLAKYKKLATDGGAAWMKHGALQYVESVADDMAVAKAWGGLMFTEMTKAKKGETVVFSFIVYKSRKHRDAVNKKVYAQMAKDYDAEKDKDMPFAMDRVAIGGFDTIVDL